MDFQQRQEYYAKFKDIAYYLIIAVVSFVAAAFLPFVGSALTGTMVWPQSPIEWAIWITTKLCVALINIILLYCFLAQAKVNIKDDKNYLEAQDILRRINKDKLLVARSPKKYFGKLWGTKGVMTFLSSILSAVVLAEAMLVFDLSSFLSYVFTVVMGVIIGYLQMRTTEEYWTSEYLSYAKDELSKWEKQKAEEEAKKEKEEQALEEIAVAEVILAAESLGGQEE